MLTGGTYIFRFSFLIDSDIKSRTKKYKSLCCPGDSNAEPKSEFRHKRRPVSKYASSRGEQISRTEWHNKVDNQQKICLTVLS